MASRGPTESFYSCHSKCVTTSKYSSSEIFSIPRSTQRHQMRGWLTAAMLVQDRDFQETCVMGRKESNCFICSAKQTCMNSCKRRQTEEEPSKSTSHSMQFHKATKALEAVHELLCQTCSTEKLWHHLLLFFFDVVFLLVSSPV